ncbi:hypothetical protein DNTS_007590 [Danionella cerebrum]|uniref:PDZ domain-containing protein n=1 Tax=Danionella cerebrum TaxID=2873325 RepID=A0A553RAK9_9TELE|nr:hypothetical protein DNTS_007590 [Danionella translucida]
MGFELPCFIISDFAQRESERERVVRGPAMALLPQSVEAEHFDGLSLLYWTIMGPHGINRAVERFEFTDCKKGLGVKIIGGYRAQSGEEFGIFIKRVLPGGSAAQDGRLRAGDLILDVNNINLGGVTNERAVEVLRMASATNHMSLLIVRDDSSRREFAELMGKYGTSSSTSSGSDTSVSTGKMTDTASSSSSSRSTSPLLLSPKDPNPLICVAKGTGLGLVIRGGANRAEGPMVFVQEIIQGSDCQKDGRIKAGDQLISINKESLVGVTHEEAKTILTRTKLRQDPTVEIAFIRRRSSSGSSSGPHSPISNQPSCSSATSQVKPSGLGGPTLPGGLVPKIANSPNSGSETLPSVELTMIRPATGKPVSAPVSSPASACTTVANSDVTAACNPSTTRRLSKHLTCAPCSEVKAEKIEQALALLGLKPSESQLLTLRERLHLNPGGTVTYADFERAAKELFKLSSKTDTKQEITRLPLNPVEVPSITAPSFSDSDYPEGMERLRKDHIEALRELKKLQDKLTESESLNQKMVLELTKVKQETKSAMEESRSLRTRIHLAEAAQKQARGMEMDYEEVIHLLEAEIAEMKSQKLEQPPLGKEDLQDLKKRISVLECQLRRSETAKKHFEVSTGKLLQFVEAVQGFLSAHQSTPKGNRKAPALLLLWLWKLRNSPRLSKAFWSWTVYRVKKLKLQVVWNAKNHVTQSTSCTHPVLRSLSLSEPGSSEQSQSSPDYTAQIPQSFLREKQHKGAADNTRSTIVAFL